MTYRKEFEESCNEVEYVFYVIAIILFAFLSFEFILMMLIPSLIIYSIYRFIKYCCTTCSPPSKPIQLESPTWLSDE